MQPSESYFDGAVRGLKEELNVNVSTVEKISEATLQQVEDQENNVYDYEFAECYKVIYDGEINSSYFNCWESIPLFYSLSFQLIQEKLTRQNL